jgi:hypothetical protein
MFGFAHIPEERLADHIFGVFFCSIFLYMFWLHQSAIHQEITVDFVEQMSEKIEEHIMFKHIINTLEESIVIASQNIIEEVNDCFLRHFGDIISRD